MSNYPDGMGRSAMLDARDVNIAIDCPNCGHVSDQDLEQFRSKIYGNGYCPNCEQEWEIEIHL